MLFFPLAFGGKACPTLCEQRIAAWKKTDGDGLPDPPKVKCPADNRKQWLPVQRMKRKVQS